MRRVAFVVYAIMVVLSICPNSAMAMPVDQAVEAIGDWLVAEQGPDGSWPGEANFTGSIVAGLATAYQVTGKAAYKTAAELGGNYIVNSAGGNYFGDEAYALASLAAITKNAAYARAAKNFYDTLDTYAYIRAFKATDCSNAVFYLAQHTVAAQKVGAADAGIWRDGLAQYLSRVGDDEAYYPVMSLGVATWALAQTGPMDDTRIDPFGLTGEDYWTDVKLSDLVDILSSHQVSSGEYADSFYHRFDHTPAGPGYEDSGYTEDTIFALLGLIAANKADLSLDLWADIIAGRNTLASRVGADGMLYEHMWSGGALYYAYGGEALQAFAAIPEPATLFLLGAGILLLRRQRRQLA